jgi:hypothetical protein
MDTPASMWPCSISSADNALKAVCVMQETRRSSPRVYINKSGASFIMFSPFPCQPTILVSNTPLICWPCDVRTGKLSFGAFEDYNNGKGSGASDTAFASTAKTPSTTPHSP